MLTFAVAWYYRSLNQHGKYAEGWLMLFAIIGDANILISIFG